MARRWNELVLVKNDGRHFCDNADGDTWEHATVSFANQRAITTIDAFDMYCHGSPHPYGWLAASTWLLRPNVRPMVETDLFRLDRNWKSRLSSAVRAGVSAQASKNGFALDWKHVTTEIDAAADDISHWTFDDRGLVVLFDNQFGMARRFAPAISVPWSELADVLVPDPPVP